jgi:hypothetical protein
VDPCGGLHRGDWIVGDGGCGGWVGGGKIVWGLGMMWDAVDER